MNDNLKMLGRYAITAATTYAMGRGWLTVEQAGALGQALIDVAGAVIAVAPALYAAFKVSNKPVTS